jgi:NADH-quinone oxidoreductase subunit G
MAENVKLTIDGKEVVAPKGMNLIEAAKLAGIEVPHYCYHPKLTIAGNCRMCLVEVGTPKAEPDGKTTIIFAPKLAIGCNTAVAGGMVVLTKSPKVVKAREGVMEFLLINHPLDCPICDQAGECRLQEFSVDYGKGASRFVEEKVRKPKRTALGQKITLDDERCILCSRCVRFMKEVAGQDCLGFVNRGSYTTLTCYPGNEPNTNYDLNIVDICPVGALTSNDFRFQQRVWFLKETKSLCPNCATGCNTVVWSREGIIYRQTPRDNEAVNQCWMCDYGRLNYKFINDPRRLTTPWVKSAAVGEKLSLTWAEATRQVADKLRGAKGLAVIGSARATTEELFLLSKFSAEWRAVVPHTGDGDTFLLNADRTPNMAGARLTGFDDDISKIIAGIKAGTIKTLIVLGEDAVEPELLAKLELLVVIDILPTKATEAAHYVLPGTTFAEKRGTFINAKGRIQRLNLAIPPVGHALPDWQILAGLLRELEVADYRTIEDVFADMARTLPALAGLNLWKIGDQGVFIPNCHSERSEESLESPGKEVRDSSQAWNDKDVER